MANMRTDGLAELSLSFEELAGIPDGLLDDMLDAGADVIQAAQQEKARAYGVYDTGRMALSIEKGKVKRTPDGKAVHIYPQGSRTRGNTTTREAEIGFINEFGKRGQPARPFIRDANESHIDEAVDAEAKIYDEFLKSKNL